MAFLKTVELESIIERQFVMTKMNDKMRQKLFNSREASKNHHSAVFTRLRSLYFRRNGVDEGNFRNHCDVNLDGIYYAPLVSAESRQKNSFFFASLDSPSNNEIFFPRSLHKRAEANFSPWWLLVPDNMRSEKEQIGLKLLPSSREGENFYYFPCQFNEKLVSKHVSSTSERARAMSCDNDVRKERQRDDDEREQEENAIKWHLKSIPRS
jgi:hypothetical protein